MGKEEKTLYHEEFAKFVDSCIISDKTLLTTTEELFTKENQAVKQYDTAREMSLKAFAEPSIREAMQGIINGGA